MSAFVCVCVSQIGVGEVSSLLSHSLEGVLEAGSDMLFRLGHLPVLSAMCLKHANPGSALYSGSPWMVERLQG